MAHGVETDRVVDQAMAFINGQNWGDDPVDRAAVEMAVMFCIAQAAANDLSFDAAVMTFKGKSPAPASKRGGRP